MRGVFCEFVIYCYYKKDIIYVKNCEMKKKDM